MDLTLADWILFLLVTFCLSICTTGNMNSTTGSSNSSSTMTRKFTHHNTSSPVSNTSLLSPPTPTYPSTPTKLLNGNKTSTTGTPITSTMSQPSLSGSMHSGTAKPTTINSSNSTAPSTPASSLHNQSEGNDDNETLLIVLGVVAGVAAVVAFFSLLLYFRTSHSCYDRLRHRHGSQSQDAFEFATVHGSRSSTLPIRTRLASLSSLRRQAICKSEPFSIVDYRDHVKRLHADSDYLFSLEYEAVGNKKYLTDVDKKLELTSHEGKKLHNKAKNRYADILPYDHSRVALTEIEDERDSTYINANYVDSYRKPRAYIAAQGPVSASLADFWRMIWENNARVIVMVTNLFERTKLKCVQYWPNKGSSSYGFLRVSLIKEEMFANYVIRTLSVEPSPNQTHYVKTKNESEPRVIQQFQFTEWPDHDVPVHPVALLRYILHSKSANPPEAGPMVVHCSAGVGRSGAYIVIDSMMERIEDDKTVDIFNFLNHIRTQRVYLVQEESQYIFVHNCILEFINFGDTNIPIRAFHKRLEALREVDPDSKTSRLRKEYEDINTTKHPEKHKWAGKKHCNVAKNRSKDILPVERTRVKLPLVLGIDGADYINASFIDGFSKKREYIATQAPMVKTAECFYRMICSTNCNIIVMLLDDEQWEKDDYADLPTEDEAVTCGRFEINLESQEVTEKVTVRKLRLFSSETSDGHPVTHYHYRDWPSNGFPKDKTSLINFIEQVRDHRMAESSEHPVTVHCDYGVGPTGVFCLVSSLYDQIEREQCVDVFHAAKLLRVQRPKLIETEDQYSFCYEVLDQVIARKLISMTPDSECDETNSRQSTSNLSYSNPNVRTNHRTGMNGSVFMDTSTSESGKKSPKADTERPSADNVEPIAGNVSPNESKADENTSKSQKQEEHTQ